MKIECMEEVGDKHYFHLDNGVEVMIETPFEDNSGWEYYNAIKDDYCEGTLWFENEILVDYDGVFGLPEEVYEALRYSGIKVDD